MTQPRIRSRRWVEREISILVGTERRPMAVEVWAWVRGGWAMHRYKYKGFSITHVPSGRSLGAFVEDLSESDARRIVMRLSKEFDWPWGDINEVPPDERLAFLAVLGEELAL